MTDPLGCIQGELLGYQMLYTASFDPEATISGQAVRAALAVPLPVDLTKPGACELAGDVIKITTADGVVVYKIGRYLADLDVYEATWPD